MTQTPQHWLEQDAAATLSELQAMLGETTEKGARFWISKILQLFAAGWTYEQIRESYPGLTDDILRRMFALAADCVTGGDRNV